MFCNLSATVLELFEVYSHISAVFLSSRISPLPGATGKFGAFVCLLYIGLLDPKYLEFQDIWKILKYHSVKLLCLCLEIWYNSVMYEMGIEMNRNKPNITETNNRDFRKSYRDLYNDKSWATEINTQHCSSDSKVRNNAMSAYSTLILTHNLHSCKGGEKEARNISFVQKCWNSSAGQQCRKFCLPKSIARRNSRPPSSKDYIPQTWWILF